MTITLTPNANVAQGELGPTLANLQAIQNSCAHSQLAKLTLDQKNQLSDALSQVRNILSSAHDALSSQQSLVSAQVQNLQTQVQNAGQPQAPVFRMMVLLANAVQACPDVQSAVTEIKAQSDVAVGAVEELQYQLNLAKIMQGNILIDLQSVQDALAQVDQLNLTLQAP